MVAISSLAISSVAISSAAISSVAITLLRDDLPNDQPHPMLAEFPPTCASLIARICVWITQ